MLQKRGNRAGERPINLSGTWLSSKTLVQVQPWAVLKSSEEEWAPPGEAAIPLGVIFFPYWCGTQSPAHAWQVLYPWAPYPALFKNFMTKSHQVALTGLMWFTCLRFPHSLRSSLRLSWPAPPYLAKNTVSRKLSRALPQLSFLELQASEADPSSVWLL